MWVLDRRGHGLAKIDPDTNEVVETVDLEGGRKRAAFWNLDASAGALWVSEPTRRLLLKIDPDTGRVAEEIELKDRTSDGYLAGDSRWLQENGDLVRLDLDTGREVGRIPFGNRNTHLGDVVEFDGSFWLTRDRSRFIADAPQGLATWMVETKLLEIDPDTTRVVSTRSLGSTFAKGPVNPVVGELEADDEGLWMSRTYENRLLFFDPRTGEVRLQFPIAAFELVWEFEVVDGDLWAGDLNGPQVMWIDPESRERKLYTVEGETSQIVGAFGSAWLPIPADSPEGGSVVRLDPPS